MFIEKISQLFIIYQFSAFVYGNNDEIGQRLTFCLFAVKIKERLSEGRKQMRNNMLQDFKKFAFKGNVVDMAVGVIIGGAFSTIVNSLVNDIIMPIFGAVTAGMDFKSLKIVLSAATETKPEAAIFYGSFIQNVINFLIIAFSIFIAIRILAKFKKEEPPAPEPPKGPTQEELLAEIRDLLKDASAPALKAAKEE